MITVELKATYNISEKQTARTEHEEYNKTALGLTFTVKIIFAHKKNTQKSKLQTKPQKNDKQMLKMQDWVYAWRYQTNSNIYIGGLADESNAGKQKRKKIPQKTP